MNKSYLTFAVLILINVILATYNICTNNALLSFINGVGIGSLVVTSIIISRNKN